MRNGIRFASDGSMLNGRRVRWRKERTSSYKQHNVCVLSDVVVVITLASADASWPLGENGPFTYATPTSLN